MISIDDVLANATQDDVVLREEIDSEKEPWLKAIADQKMPWTHLSDLKGWRTVASSVYDVNSIPDNLLIDPQGKIVARGLRAQGLQNKLKEIFGE